MHNTVFFAYLALVDMPLVSLNFFEVQTSEVSYLDIVAGGTIYVDLTYEWFVTSMPPYWGFYQ